MAAADYRLCDVCGGKAFYDSNLCYEDEREAPDRAPYRIAGEASDWGYRLGYLGDWAVVCDDCAKTHRTRIEPIVAARELDVEAEPLQTFEKWWATPTTSTAAPYTFMHEQSAHAAWLAARSAAQSTAPSNSPEFDGIAPVSTEQAGDAWIDLKQRKPGDWEQVLVALDNGTVTVGMRGSMGWHWEESDAPEDAEATATHWKPWPVAPSPSNSPVGGED